MSENSSGTTRKTWLWLALAALVIIVAIVAVVVAQRSGSEDAANGPERAGGGEWTVDVLGRDTLIPDDEAGTILSQSKPDGNRVEWSNGTEPITAPEGVQLQQVGIGIQVPVSTSDGPTGFADDGWRTTGYAHTGQGAVLFAADTMQRSIADVSKGQAVLIERAADPGVVPEPDAGRDLEAEMDEMADSPASLAPQYFRTGQCSPNRCKVELLSGSFADLDGGDVADGSPAQAGHLRTSWLLVWDDGQWKLDDYSRELIDVDSLNGWQTWQ